MQDFFANTDGILLESFRSIHAQRECTINVSHKALEAHWKHLTDRLFGLSASVTFKTVQNSGL
jgi:hypothetical protein